MPFRLPPRIASGGSRPPSRPSTVAPIRRSGSAMRPMGRRRSGSVPVSSVVKGCPATRPERRRIVVPEPLQCSTSAGSARPSRPRPCTRRRPLGSSSISAPSACMHRSVARQTSAGTQPAISVSPSAIVASIKARWVMDLSPGTVTAPRSGPEGRMIRSGMVLLGRKEKGRRKKEDPVSFVRLRVPCVLVVRQNLIPRRVSRARASRSRRLGSSPLRRRVASAAS